MSSSVVPLDGAILRQMVEDAYSDAVLAVMAPHASRGALHASRSQAFVRGLADRLKHHFSGDSDTCVFSKDDRTHKAAFTLCELLYDIHVCETSELPVASRRPIRFVRSSVLQLESELEFRGSVKPQVVDFSKLVVGSAGTKAFIGGHRGDTTTLRHALRHVAAHAHGALYCYFIPHPELWSVMPGPMNAVEAYTFGAGDWIEINAPAG